ncbi:MAG: sulfotransferase, partial [Planctomycetes bacterium]|nr:sulfotransferase [Planctomycetota bacterium]
WACDLAAIGLAFRQYERLMAHWRDVLDLPILEVQYESLVGDQAAQSQRLIEFLGLDWDERCLRFHETSKDAKRAGIAPTLSYNQVRRPVYRSSCGRWEPFKPHLGPLIEALGLGTNLDSTDPEKR